MSERLESRRHEGWGQKKDWRSGQAPGLGDFVPGAEAPEGNGKPVKGF